MPEDKSNGSNKLLEPEQFRKLFIGGLSANTTDDILKEYYSQFGEILDHVVMKDPQTKRSRLFGFVTYSSQEEVDKAMAARPHYIDGKTIEPKRAVPREASAKAESNMTTKRLYISGIREFHTEDDLNEYFGQFGKVEQSEIIREKSTGKPRGFAFINFDDYDAVDKCVLQRSHMIKDYRCDVKKALSKEDAARAQQMDKDRSFRGDRSRGNERGGRGGRGGPGGYGGGGPGGGYGGGPGGYGAGGPGPWGPPAQGGWGGGYGGGPQGGYGGGSGGGGYDGGYGSGGSYASGGGYGGSGGYGAKSDPWSAGQPSGGYGGGGGGSYGGAPSGQPAPSAWGSAPSGGGTGGYQQQSWGPPQGSAPQPGTGPGGWAQGGGPGGWGPGAQQGGGGRY